MKVLVTGAGGFLGRHVVDMALRHEMDVVALIRPAADVPAHAAFSHPRLRVARVDLRAPDGLCDALSGVDSVIHLAAGTGGDFASQFAAAVVATEQLLQIMSARDIRSLVHVSTFSVYDYSRLRVGSNLDEHSPTDLHPEGRDPYAATKLLQEELVWRFADQGSRIVVLRPGMVFGPGKLWNGVALQLGPVAIRIGPDGAMPLTFVENCAEAIVLASTAPRAAGQIINVVDDETPTQWAYARALRRHAFPAPIALPVPYRLAASSARILAAVNRSVWGGRAKLPGLLVPMSVDARFKPLDYPNAVAKDLLGWQPRFSLDAALARLQDQVASKL